MSDETEICGKARRQLSFYDLPPDVLLIIFHYLDLKSVCRISRVCRLWHSYANHPSIWRVVDLRPYQISLRVLWNILQRRLSENTKELQIKGLVTTSKKLENLSNPLLEEINRRAPGLDRISLINCYLKNVKIESFPRGITDLSLAESLIPLGWFETLKSKNLFPSLENLDLTSCTRISSEDISSICHIQTLKNLTLAGCYRITDDDVKVISTKLNLRKLDLCGCKKIKDVSLHHIARHLKDIQSLSFAKCPFITPLGISSLKDGCLSKLSYLNIQECGHETQQTASKLFANISEITLKICEIDPE